MSEPTPKNKGGRPRKNPPKQHQYRREKKIEDLVRVLISLPQSDLDRLKSAAKSENRSVSGLIQKFIAGLDLPDPPNKHAGV